MTRNKSGGNAFEFFIAIVATIGTILFAWGSHLVVVYFFEHPRIFLICIIGIILLVIGVIALRLFVLIKKHSSKNMLLQQMDDSKKTIPTEHQRIYSINNNQTSAPYSSILNNIDFRNDGTIVEEENYVNSIDFVKNDVEHRNKNKKSKSWTDKNISLMSGRDFEYFCADLLRCNGFSKVVITQASKDKGVDIIAWRNDEKYAIQCKCYTDNKVGFQAVQEVYTGKAIYDCKKAMVMTNSKFTEEAIESAQKLGVILLNGNTLREWSKHMK